MKTLCYFINASFYRENIYRKLNDNLNCDLIIGEKVSKIKEMDLDFLTNLKLYFKRKKLIYSIYYDSGTIQYFISNRKKYDSLIIGGDAYSISVWTVLCLSRLFGIKSMVWTHGWYGRESRFTCIVKKIFFGLANKVFVYGDYAKQGLAKNNIVSEKKIVIVYNSLDYEQQLELRNQIKPSPIYKNYFNNDEPNLVFVGRLILSKKLDMLLDAVKILEEKGHSINIVFIGAGEALETLKEKTHVCGLNNVWFYGACYEQKQLSEMIYNADLCVSPGEVGLTAMHSMMFGTPVITHNNFSFQGPEFEAIKVGETGDFFQHDDVRSLAECIQCWLEKNLQRDLVRIKCYNIVDMFYNPKNQIDIISKTIKELLNSI